MSAMSAYEEDLEYACTFLKIRELMQNMHTVFRIRTIGTEDIGCYEYRLPINGSSLVVGHLNKTPSDTPIMSCLNHSLVHDNRHDRFIITNYINGKQAEVKYYTIPDVIGEEWYFQKSLVQTPDVMTRLVLFNVLRSTECSFPYFQINMFMFDKVKEIMGL